MKIKQGYLLYLALILLILALNKVVAQEEVSYQSQEKISPQLRELAPKTEDGEIKDIHKKCSVDDDCGKPYFYGPPYLIVINVPKCIQNVCLNFDYVPDDIIEQGKEKALKEAVAKIKAEMGETFFNEHFEFVEVSHSPDYKEFLDRDWWIPHLNKSIHVPNINIDIDPESVHESKVPAKCLTFLVSYNVTWIVDGEKLGVPFGVSFRACSYDLEFESSSTNLEPRENLINRDGARLIAEKNDILEPFSYFEFGSRSIDGQLIPTWSVRRELKPDETKCKDYKISVLINAFSGEVINNYYDNPCEIKVGGGLRTPAFNPGVIILIIAGIIVITLVFLYVALRRRK